MLKKHDYRVELNSVIFASTKVKPSFRDHLFESEHCQSGKGVPLVARLGQVSPDQVKPSMWRQMDVAGTLLKLGDNVKSLRVTLDRQLSFDKHVNLVRRACDYHLWSLRHIRKYLTVDLANTIACSVVASRLDYCYSILYKTTKATITKLQRVQKSLARVGLQMPRRAHADDLLARLHWLPVS